jgi:hypothetical protein
LGEPKFTRNPKLKYFPLLVRPLGMIFFIFFRNSMKILSVISKIPVNIDNLMLKTAVQSSKYQFFWNFGLKFHKFIDFFKILKTSNISPG